MCSGKMKVNYIMSVKENNNLKVLSDVIKKWENELSILKSVGLQLSRQITIFEILQDIKACKNNEQNVISCCSTCKFWTQNTFYNYEGAENDGFCSELSTELEIDLKTGWDGGYVEKIETKSSFGCVRHNKA